MITLEVNINNGYAVAQFNLGALGTNNQIRIGDIDIIVVEIANMGMISPHHKEFAIKAENSKNGDRGIERINIDTRNGGSHHSINISTGHIDEVTEKDIINKINERMYFLENLTDLWVGEFITKQRYMQLRKLFKTEERDFAIRVVRELHVTHILTNVPIKDLIK